MSFTRIVTTEWPFSAYAERVVANGWNVVPLPAGGKRCLLEGWPTYQFSRNDLQKFRHHGIGILTTRTPAVDVDVLDAKVAGEIAAKVAEILSDGPERIGRAPKALRPYRLGGKPFKKMVTGKYRLPGDPPDGTPGYKGHRVEILAEGEQFVAYNRHPDTGKPYTWTDGEPLDTHVDELPVITRELARRVIRACEKILAKYGQLITEAKDGDGKPHEPNPSLKADDAALLRAALAHIPNDDCDWDRWSNVGLAIKGALGEEGRTDWLAWSARSGKDDPEVTTKQWKTFKPHSIGAGSIFYWAEQAGWVKPKAKETDKAAPFVLSEHVESVSKMLRREIAPVSYLFDDLIARGALSILGGPPKGFKSTLMMWLSLVMVGASRSNWGKFQRTDEERLRVGYLDLEQADPLYLERLAQFHPNPKALKRLLRINAFPKFDSAGIEQLGNLIVDHRLDAVFVDTLARVRNVGGPSRSATDVDAELLDPATKLAHRTGCHIMIGAHCGKRKDYDNPIDMLASTSALAAAADDCFIIFKPKGCSARTTSHPLRERPSRQTAGQLHG